jgi:hypothetical protein
VEATLEMHNLYKRLLSNKKKKAPELWHLTLLRDQLLYNFACEAKATIPKKRIGGLLLKASCGLRHGVA